MNNKPFKDSCTRNNCFAYESGRCVCLHTSFPDDYKCVFFKTKTEVEEQQKILNK